MRWIDELVQDPSFLIGYSKMIWMYPSTIKKHLLGRMYKSKIDFHLQKIAEYFKREKAFEYHELFIDQETLKKFK